MSGLRAGRRAVVAAMLAGLVVSSAAFGSLPQATAFDWTVGDWSGTRHEPESGRNDPMTMRVTSVLGGEAQLREIEIKTERSTYRGLAIQVFDSARTVWVRQYTNAGRGSFSTLEGRVESPDRSVWIVVSAGRSRESRLVSEWLGSGVWRRTMSVSTDGGESWRVLWIDELERSSGP